MSVYGTFLRRQFEPIVLSVQVVIDLAVLLLACFLGFEIARRLGHTPEPAGALMTQAQMYRDLSALIAAVCLVTFHAFGMYSPTKSLLNMEEFKAIAKSTVVAFLVLLTLLIYLRAPPATEHGGWLSEFHDWIRPKNFEVESLSRVALLYTFGLILVLTTASRFASFKVIQGLHRGGIGNRNALIYGAGPVGRKLLRKFELVPTLGLNLVGFVDEGEQRVGERIDRCSVLGKTDDLERLIALHKVSEVFVATPELEEERLLELLAQLERLGVQARVVPRFHHLLSFKVRIENLDSIPLITRAETRPGLFVSMARRLLDLGVALLVLLATLPVWLIAALLIKRESPGPVFFRQMRVGRDGVPFRMYKFRTMHQHMSGDAPTPRSHEDPRITNIGRWLRRFSLDELPQFLNVLLGDMSVVGPRPEMQFIVDKYSALERERLRVKPGITGLWQISYARQMAIHENIDYDLYYIEHQSLLLDIVIISLTAFAVVKGTGAY
ncbi:MAG: sugar transferase [Planctomycetes bacterium]|nr:sugar transferase [Planctomycetota bacterium]